MEPFQKHRASPGELARYASGLLDDAAAASGHSATTQQRYAPAVANWSGVGTAQLQAAPVPLRTGADEACQALAWAGVCAQIWGDKVDTFNSEVDRITGDLAMLGDDWGATGTGGQLPTDTEIADARGSALGSARQRWWTAYNTHILDGEDEVAGMLDDGPTERRLAEASHYGGTVAAVVDAIQGGVVGGVAARLAGDLRNHADWLRNRAAWHNSQYLRPGATPADRAFHNNRAFRASMAADRAALRSTGMLRTVGARIPIVGIGVTAIGVGYDISQGKPATQAVVSGAGGLAAGMAVGAAVGSVVPVAGTAIGAVVGAGVGWAVSTGIDWAFEHSDEIEDAISSGAELVGDAADAIGDGAEKVWDSIF